MDEYVNLGLPSGKLWKSAPEEGYYTFDEAVEKFRSQLPSREDIYELLRNTTKDWDAAMKGVVITGKNGNTLFLPARGYRYCSDEGLVGDQGFYWLSKPNAYFPDRACCLYFDDDHMNPEYIIDRSYSQSVVLVK